MQNQSIAAQYRAGNRLCSAFEMSKRAEENKAQAPLYGSFCCSIFQRLQQLQGFSERGHVGERSLGDKVSPKPLLEGLLGEAPGGVPGPGGKSGALGPAGTTKERGIQGRFTSLGSFTAGGDGLGFLSVHCLLESRCLFWGFGTRPEDADSAR